MTNDEIEPMVPVMPRQPSSSGIVADGGEASIASRSSTDVFASVGGRQRRYEAAEVEAPLVPEC